MREITIINNRAGLPLHKWTSNFEPILKDVQREDGTVNENLLEFERKGEKVLGLKWLNTSDFLAFNPFSHGICADY